MTDSPGLTTHFTDPKGAKVSRLSFARVIVLSLMCSLLAACGARQPQGIDDLRHIPQSVTAHLNPVTAGERLLSPDAQARMYARFLEEHFGPWHRTQPRWNSEHVFWGLKVFANKTIFGENTLRRDADWLREMRRRSDTANYPSALGPAIAVANASMRVLPTNKPVFYDFSLAGEGFPFDYAQNTNVWAGTPLYVSHVSADGAWYLCESRFAYGWVSARNVALVSPEFRSAFETSQMLALTDDRQPIRDDLGLHLGMGRIGMVLPTDDETCPVGTFAALFPVSDDHGMAQLRRVFLPEDAARPMPLTPTPATFAALADRLMGQQYGWGGLYGNRDCSAMIMDLYAPFGINLPRNSRQQLEQGGRFTDMSQLDLQQKRRTIVQEGLPFMTILGKPGHVMVYIGTGQGSEAGPSTDADGLPRPLALHTMWGLKTSENGKPGRQVIGKTVLTTTTPGRELGDLAQPQGLLLHIMKGYTRVDLPPHQGQKID